MRFAFLLVWLTFCNYAASYVLGTHWGTSDRTILQELNTVGQLDIVNYPLCIYSESGGVSINDPARVQKMAETALNTWLQVLYRRTNFRSRSVRFRLRATTERGCQAEYRGRRPFSITSFQGGAYGGMAVRIRLRFPGHTINNRLSSTTLPQTLLHEVGHIIGLMHTMGQSTQSVMDYDDMHKMTGISNDDIQGMLHIWRFLNGQATKRQCQPGYVGGPACVRTRGRSRIDDGAEADGAPDLALGLSLAAFGLVVGALVVNSCIKKQSAASTFLTNDRGTQLPAQP
jgi:hypothetical protein